MGGGTYQGNIVKEYGLSVERNDAQLKLIIKDASRNYGSREATLYPHSNFPVNNVGQFNEKIGEAIAAAASDATITAVILQRPDGLGYRSLLQGLLYEPLYMACKLNPTVNSLTVIKKVMLLKDKKEVWPTAGALPLEDSQRFAYQVTQLALAIDKQYDDLAGKETAKKVVENLERLLLNFSPAEKHIQAYKQLSASEASQSIGTAQPNGQLTALTAQALVAQQQQFQQQWQQQRQKWQPSEEKVEKARKALQKSQLPYSPAEPALRQKQGVFALTTEQRQSGTETLQINAPLSERHEQTLLQLLLQGESQVNLRLLFSLIKGMSSPFAKLPPNNKTVAELLFASKQSRTYRIKCVKVLLQEVLDRTLDELQRTTDKKWCAEAQTFIAMKQSLDDYVRAHLLPALEQEQQSTASLRSKLFSSQPSVLKSTAPLVIEYYQFLATLLDTDAAKRLDLSSPWAELRAAANKTETGRDENLQAALQHLEKCIEKLLEGSAMLQEQSNSAFQQRTMSFRRTKHKETTK